MGSPCTTMQKSKRPTRCKRATAQPRLGKTSKKVLETLKKAIAQAESQHATPTPGEKKQMKDGATDNARREGEGEERAEEGEGEDSHKGQKGHSLHKENRQGDQSSNLHGEGPPGKPARKQKNKPRLEDLPSPQAQRSTTPRLHPREGRHPRHGSLGGGSRDEVISPSALCFPGTSGVHPRRKAQGSQSQRRKAKNRKGREKRVNTHDSWESSIGYRCGQWRVCAHQLRVCNTVQWFGMLGPVPQYYCGEYY